MDSYCFLVIIVVMGFSCFQADQALSSQNLPCNINDIKALQDFMTGFKTMIHGWSTNYTSDCCKWTGITCSFSSSLGLDNSTETAGRVVKLELPKKKLAGTLSESIGTLDQLKVLNLSLNFLQGSLPLPLFHLRNLQVLDLSSNDFSGPVPNTIFLPSIQILGLSQNSLKGNLPVSICDHASTLLVLKTTSLFFVAHSNNFTGSIPSSLTNSYTLTVLNIRNNSLEGSVDLNCSAMVSLTSLDLGSNRLSGPILDNLPSCGRLNNINLARNTILRHCKNLTTWVLPGNFQNEELSADSTLHFHKLKILVIANCRLTGSIPYPHNLGGFRERNSPSLKLQLT
ncbi:hypothetical protein FEM48_Zijuj09G0179800 [Ziziphus jujuba var. spinosa]|uniref:Leucine-rich repeat-containing N-terminal plant-type domain-containing protein n=1 Tax=Ziziphus jujuba var. spinosa TaxID=714518 RepID=A0A978UUG4_ZIZJJ|nr:hypothetical protein FEM48_Zijuj09G0179800 [Ziziphus jujuba var. spinosa]